MPSTEQDATAASLPVLFRRLIEGLHQRTCRRVVLMVDASWMLWTHRSRYASTVTCCVELYANIKFADAHIQFTLSAGEGFYASVFYSYFATLGFDIIFETTMARACQSIVEKY
ncbi:MAG: hypothetical protein OXI96_00785 [Acidimicrobiaceae bacterium]|nr:hypothetical protein [Acidimicrobiaceae bacterium]